MRLKSAQEKTLSVQGASEYFEYRSDSEHDWNRRFSSAAGVYFFVSPMRLGSVSRALGPALTKWTWCATPQRPSNG
jgi:hypothetical protein